ncbi:hypothetical protein NM208_g10513 [Fusarium decemcellulare]|uniref:Uncharacterized protein n=1 Tax=Fusarium decemcellulare TaxID=57161 RepID=A0ACC1RXQ1_9HYPO|nr:hypothetical protein NM208_g10513 [Fusarium decemcellulare]
MPDNANQRLQQLRRRMQQRKRPICYGGKRSRSPKELLREIQQRANEMERSLEELLEKAAERLQLPCPRCGHKEGDQKAEEASDTNT